MKNSVTRYVVWLCLSLSAALGVRAGVFNVILTEGTNAPVHLTNFKILYAGDINSSTDRVEAVSFDYNRQYVGARTRMVHAISFSFTNITKVAYTRFLRAPANLFDTMKVASAEGGGPQHRSTVLLGAFDTVLLTQKDGTEITVSPKEQLFLKRKDNKEIMREKLTYCDWGIKGSPKRKYFLGFVGKVKTTGEDYFLRKDDIKETVTIEFQ